MKWLAQRQQERRWWTASASIAILGLVLGVLGVVPAFATRARATCSVTVAEGIVEVEWAGVPRGIAVEVLSQDAAGYLTTVANDGGAAAGFGPVGSWSGAAVPGAVAYHIFASATSGGGTLHCTDLTVPDGGGDDSGVSDGGGDDSGADGVSDGGGDDSGSDGGGSARIEAVLGVDCDAEAVTVEITNTGDADGIAEIEIGGRVTEVVTVAAGASASRNIRTPLVNTAVRVLVDGVVVAASTLDQPCTSNEADLSASAMVDCDNDTVTVEITNRGTAAGTATVVVGEQVIVDVLPGRTERVTVARPSDPSLQVVVTFAGATLLSTMLDTSCEEPAPELSGKLQLLCDAETPSMRTTVTNSGRATGTVIVEVNGEGQTLRIAAGATEVLVVPIPVEGPVTVTVRTDDGELLASSEGENICDKPSVKLAATAALDCVRGQIQVTVTNAGDLPGTAFVDIGGRLQTVQVRAGEATVVTGDVAPGSDIRVVVHNGIRSLLDQQFTGSCATPEPEISARWSMECGYRTVTVVLRNAGDDSGEAIVQLGGTVEVRRVGPGEEARVTMPAPVFGSQTLTVRGEVATAVQVLIDVSVGACAEPVPDVRASAVTDCQLGQIVLSMTNQGTGAATARWSINARNETAVIQPGATLVVAVDIVVGETNRVIVVVGDQTVLDQSIPQACRPDEPVLGAEFVIDCANDEIVVRVFNNGSVDGTARVAINGEITEVSVAADDLVTVRGVLAPNASYLIDVSSGAESLLTEQGTAAECFEEPSGLLSASVRLSCRYDEATVTVRNDDDEPRDVVVTVDGDEETATVAPGERIELVYGLVEDTGYEISVVSNGQQLAFARGTHDCVQVGGTVVVPPPHVDNGTPISLPNTGANSGALVAAGMTLIAAGLLALRASKIRQRRLVIG